MTQDRVAKALDDIEAAGMEHHAHVIRAELDRLTAEANAAEAAAQKAEGELDALDRFLAKLRDKP